MTSFYIANFYPPTVQKSQYYSILPLNTLNITLLFSGSLSVVDCVPSVAWEASAVVLVPAILIPSAVCPSCCNNRNCRKLPACFWLSALILFQVSSIHSAVAILFIGVHHPTSSFYHRWGRLASREFAIDYCIVKPGNAVKISCSLLAGTPCTVFLLRV